MLSTTPSLSFSCCCLHRLSFLTASVTPFTPVSSTPRAVPAPGAGTSIPPTLSSTVTWLSPTSLASLTAIQQQYVKAPAGTLQFVCGNTSYGVEKYLNGTGCPTPYTVLVDVTNVPELTAESVTATGVTVGGAVSIKRVIEICHEQDPMSPLFTNDPATEGVKTATSSFAALARHLLRVATQQVRAVASWAGNVMLATHYHEFPSDVVLVSEPGGKGVGRRARTCAKNYKVKKQRALRSRLWTCVLGVRLDPG